MNPAIGILLGIATFLAISTSNASAADCVKLDRVTLKDDILNKEKQRQLFRPYMHQCIDGRLVKSLLDDVASYYLSHGYITTQPYLKQQDVRDGELEISLVKGYVEDIVEASTGRSSDRIRSAFAFQKGAPLNLRSLETSLEMVNRPTSVDAKFNLKPGTKSGASIVEVSSKETSPLHLQLGATGRQNMNRNNLEFTAEVSLDNPLNINDILTYRHNGSGVQKEYQSNNGGELNYSFPISSYLYELVWSNFSYRQGVSGVNNIYLASGDTQGLRAKISKVLMRNQRNKLTVAASVYHKDTKNYFSGQLIGVSSYRTTLAQLDATHTYLREWGRILSTYSYYRGVDWFGARTDAYVSASSGGANTAKLQFAKHSFDVNALYYMGDQSFQFSSNFHIQFTKDLLYDNDKQSVGSDYTVRGYRDQNLYGNNAWYTRNDITKTWMPEIDRSLLRSVSLLAGMDYGKVKCEVDNATSCGEAVGFAVGTSTQGDNLSTSFVWSRPLKKLSGNFKYKNLVKLDVSWSF